MQLLGLAVYKELPAEQKPPRRACAWVHGRHGRPRQSFGEENLEACFERCGFYSNHVTNPLHVMVAMIIHKRLTSRLHSTIREPLQRLLWLRYASDEFTSRQVQLEELC